MITVFIIIQTIYTQRKFQKIWINGHTHEILQNLSILQN